MEDNKKVQNEGKAGVVQEVTKTLEANKEPETVGSEGRKQKVSASYTIRAFGENAKKLREMGYITKDQEEVILSIKKEIGEKYMREELGI